MDLLESFNVKAACGPCRFTSSALLDRISFPPIPAVPLKLAMSQALLQA
jgi:hypothetical protein